MFTGIVTDVGVIRTVQHTNRDLRLEIQTRFELASIEIGASISHSGCCLTVVEKGPDWFAVELSEETLENTTARTWLADGKVNLERAAKLGDEMGGHIVSGHVDGVGVITSISPEGGSHRVEIQAPRPLHRYIAAKGSITVDGVSLTVNTVDDDRFCLNIIPHTWDVTTLGHRQVGDRVNLEIDMLARYLARWQETSV
jgi:riboflavin synthase